MTSGKYFHIPSIIFWHNICQYIIVWIFRQFSYFKLNCMVNIWYFWHWNLRNNKFPEHYFHLFYCYVESKVFFRRSIEIGFSFNFFRNNARVWRRKLKISIKIWFISLHWLRFYIFTHRQSVTLKKIHLLRKNIEEIYFTMRNYDVLQNFTPLLTLIQVLQKWIRSNNEWMFGSMTKINYYVRKTIYYIKYELLKWNTHDL